MFIFIMEINFIMFFVFLTFNYSWSESGMKCYEVEQLLTSYL